MRERGDSTVDEIKSSHMQNSGVCDYTIITGRKESKKK